MPKIKDFFFDSYTVLLYKKEQIVVKQYVISCIQIEKFWNTFQRNATAEKQAMLIFSLSFDGLYFLSSVKQRNLKKPEEREVH